MPYNSSRLYNDCRILDFRTINSISPSTAANTFTFYWGVGILINPPEIFSPKVFPGEEVTQTKSIWRYNFLLKSSFSFISKFQNFWQHMVLRQWQMISNIARSRLTLYSGTRALWLLAASTSTDCTIAIPLHTEAQFCSLNFSQEGAHGT